MTWTFMPLLLQSCDPRLIFVTGLDTFEESAREDFPLRPLERGWPKKVEELETVGYRCTKTALNMLMLDYHHKLQMDGVKVWCVGPGFLATDVGEGANHPSIGGRLLKSVVEGKRDGDTGRFIVKDRMATTTSCLLHYR